MASLTGIPALTFRLFTERDALAVASWRYPEPSTAYDLDLRDHNVLAALLRPENRYHAMWRENELIGFFCLGQDARVAGWDYDDSALDLGMGLHPDLIGKSHGSLYLGAILSYLGRRYSGTALRATIAVWNQRAIRLCQRTGFQEIARFKSMQKKQMEYVVLLRRGR